MTYSTGLKLQRFSRIAKLLLEKIYRSGRRFETSSGDETSWVCTAGALNGVFAWASPGLRARPAPNFSEEPFFGVKGDAVALCFSEPDGSPVPRSIALNFNRTIEYRNEGYA
jgi:hypothetical protein